jgi:hypothetical protein
MSQSIVKPTIEGRVASYRGLASMGFPADVIGLSSNRMVPFANNVVPSARIF